MPVNIVYSATPTTENAHGVEKRAIGKSIFLNQANGTPISLAPGLPDLEQQFAEMGIVDLRTHDWHGVCDIDSCFDTTDINYLDQITNNAPDNVKKQINNYADDFFNRRTICLNAPQYFSAEEEPLFNWQPTDTYLKKSLSNKYYQGEQKPNILFRIGRILNGGKQKPTNIEKYCQLVKKLVERYSINYHLIGLAYPISEYEIWNEPDLGFFWATPENNQRAVVEFYDFYRAVANTIRATAPWVKIGSCGTAFVFKNENFVDNFIAYIKNNHIPFDFYSYHYYAIDTANPKNIYEIQEYVRSTLNKYGFQQVKCYITEWALTANASKINNTKLQSHVAAAYLLSFLIHAEQAGVDKAYLYRADGAEFGLFDNSAYATYAAQAFWLYNQFASQRDSSIIKLTDTSKTGITTTGAINANNQINILVANYTADPTIVGESGQTKLPTGVKLQSQYYIDTAIPATLIDSERWYGSNNVPPRNRNKVLYNGKPVPNGANSPNQNDQLKYDDANYQQSSKGYIVTVTDIPANFNHYTIILHKVFNGGQRQTLNGETFIYEPYGTISQSREIVIKDDDPNTAGNNTLALITIELY